MSRSEEDLLRFAGASFPSVWALELVLALRREPRAWSQEELVAALRASELVVAKAVDGLVAAGLASIGGDGVTYLPVNAEVDQCVRAVEQLYRSHPNRVRRAIISASSRGATAFADAFKLRKDGDD